MISNDYIMDSFWCCGNDVHIYPYVVIVNPLNLSLGEHIVISEFVHMMVGEGSKLEGYNHIAASCVIGGGGEFTMGKFSNVSGGCRIYTGTDDFHGEALIGPTVPGAFRKVRRSYVRIGPYAILGAGVIVMPGVNIGEGAVIGAGSLVLKDVEAWTVNVGNPLRKINVRASSVILRMERELCGVKNACNTDCELRLHG